MTSRLGICRDCHGARTSPARLEAPGLGEHTDVVMKSVLGMPEADIAALKIDGAFG